MDTITHLLESSNKSKLGHVVWLGCGLANDAKSICTLKPSKLVLVEAIEELTNKLERRFQGDDIVDITNYCISEDGQPTIFYHTQPHKFSSLQEPTELVHYYPNAVVDSVSEHPTLSANSLLSDYELNPNHFNVLIMELNGYEQALISCIKKQYLHQFDAVIVAQTIHCDVSNKEQFKQEMGQLAFQLADSEGSYRAYLRNDIQLRIQQLENLQLEWQEKQKNLESDNEKLCSDRSLLEAQLEQLQENNQDLSEINENAVAHIHQLLNDNEQLEAKESELLSSFASLESRLSHLESSNSSLEARNSDLIKQNTQLTEAKKAVELESEKIKAEIEQVQGEKDKAQEERNLAQSKVNELTQEFEQQKEQLEAKQSELLSRLSDLESSNSSLETCNADLIKQNTELTEAKKVVELENGKLKAESDKAQGERDKAQKERNLAQSRVNEITQQLEQHKQQSEVEQSELLSRLSHLESSNSSLESENLELTRSARLNQKMLAKSQVDLDDLREKYAAKLQSETELVELIKELREKLTIASQYYYQLQQEHPELLAYSDSVEGE
mgnify:CR=1 FL=1